MRKASWLAFVAAASVLALSGCSSHKHATLDPFAGKGSPYYSKKGPLPKGGGKYLVGDAYQVAGRWFTPKEQPGYDKTGLASWYGPQFHRRRTSNGEWFDMNDITAAHATLPLPSYAKVTNLENGREVIVRINDRGPFVGTRIIDLSKRSAEILGYKNKGMAKVRVQYIGPAPLNDNGNHLIAMNRELSRGTPLRQMIVAANGDDVRIPAPVQVAAVEEPPTVTALESKRDYFVQVGSFSDPENAVRAREDVAGLGPVEIQELEGSAGLLYRVRLGPIASESQAEEALSQVVGAGHDDARLVVAQNDF
jgi:rare lipoprotein A